jgi:hypothetical protein
VGVGGKGNQRDRRGELRRNLLAGAYSTTLVVKVNYDLFHPFPFSVFSLVREI